MSTESSTVAIAEEKIETKNLTALPFALIGSLNPDILLKNKIIQSIELKPTEFTSEPFGHKTNDGKWVLELENKFIFKINLKLSI